MGVHLTKTIVIGCWLAKILVILGSWESFKTFNAEATIDKGSLIYCQLAEACSSEKSKNLAQFIDSESTIDKYPQKTTT
ncbi:MAG: hypothetical protein AAGD25_09505 [Cyanobacteria bacterium P01_F01_bin.150]